MKKITLVVPDGTSIGDLSELMGIAIEFKMETIPNPDQPRRTQPFTKHVDREGLSTRDCVLAHYTPEGTFTKNLVGKWLAEKGFSANSASPCITDLRRNGHLVDVGPGKYKWLKGK